MVYDVAWRRSRPILDLTLPMKMRMQFPLRLWAVGGLFVFLFQVGVARAADAIAPEATALLERFCIDCHGVDEPEGALDLDSILSLPMADHLGKWEAVVRKIRARQMPPSDAARPDEEEYQALSESLVSSLDLNAEHHPNPGRIDTLRRLLGVVFLQSAPVFSIGLPPEVPLIVVKSVCILGHPGLSGVFGRMIAIGIIDIIPCLI